MKGKRKHLSQENKFGHSDDRPPVKDFLLEQEGGLFIDIGANTGFYTFNLAGNFEKVIAYEPFFANVDYMEMIRQRYKFENVEIRAIAIAARNGHMEFFLSPRGAKCHSLLPVGMRSVKIPCKTLAREIPNEKIDLIKVDTEGTEFDVIRSAEPIMGNIRAWLVEVHNLTEICGPYAEVRGTFDKRCEEMEEYLQSFGYKTKWITEKNVIYAWRE